MVQFDAGLTWLTEDLLGARVRFLIADHGDNVSGFEHGAGSGDVGLVLLLDPADDEAVLLVDAEDLGNGAANNARVADNVIPHHDLGGFFNGLRRDAPQPAHQLQAHEHTDHADGIGDAVGNHWLISQSTHTLEGQALFGGHFAHGLARCRQGRGVSEAPQNRPAARGLDSDRG